MPIIFITGLSGVGKTSVLKHMKKWGYNVVDTDFGYLKSMTMANEQEMILDEEKLLKLIQLNEKKTLIISGCYSNQGIFYKYFDYVVLLNADLKVMLERIDQRTDNHYGKKPNERAEIIDSELNILPLLIKGSDIIIDTSQIDIESVCKIIINSTNL